MKEQEEATEIIRKEFATIAEKVAYTCEARSAELIALNKAGGEPLEQMAVLDAKHKAHYDDKLIEEAEAVAAKASEANVIVNSYTKETIFSLRSEWKAVNDAFKSSKDVVEQLVFDQRGSKLTTEQIKEVREVFDYFDKNKNNTLDSKEFHDACQGIGLILDDAEVLAIYKSKTGSTAGVEDAGSMSFEIFSEFMFDQLKTGASEEDVLGAYKFLSKSETISELQINEHLGTRGDMADYHLRSMTKKGDGYDYMAFTTKLFSV
jgi:Ca2+-binding EF-hand superfamily protein